VEKLIVLPRKLKHGNASSDAFRRGEVEELYDMLSLHPGVWFFLGCVFIVVLLILREIYYKKKAT
jgi:hypothetical protein